MRSNVSLPLDTNRLKLLVRTFRCTGALKPSPERGPELSILSRTFGSEARSKYASQAIQSKAQSNHMTFMLQYAVTEDFGTNFQTSRLLAL